MLSVEGSLSLGSNKMICLVRWKDLLLLVGVTDHAITLLKSDLSESQSPGPTVQRNAPDFPEMPDASSSNPTFLQCLGDEIKKRISRGRGTFLALALLVLCVAGPLSTAYAAPVFGDIPVPDININLAGETQGGLKTALGILGLLTVLTLAPAILILTTSFTRIAMVFSFLRSGLGTQQTPPNQVLMGLALLLTFFVMAPTWAQVNERALTPYLAGSISAQDAYQNASGPLKSFMLKQTRQKDLALFAQMSSSELPSAPEDLSLVQVVPAFAISELKTAFQMGFLIYLPFLVIDMVVASTLMAMGMLMLPPVLISLPFKILLFVLVDGWGLVSKTLIAGFH